MELITNIVIEYLKHNKRLVVPKLGVFIVKQPSGVIRFSDLIRNDDGVLRSLIMAYGAKEIEAEGMIDRFVFEIHHAIGQGETFVIENLGEFSRGENNTTIFVHKIEPKVFGGKIKPPVETFDDERRRLLRAMGREESAAAKDTAERSEPAVSKRKKNSDDGESIIKPDAYLRGLKYDNDKKKRRGDDGNQGRSNRGNSNLLTVVLLLLLVVGIVWGVWQWRGGNGMVNTKMDDTTIAPDTTMLIAEDSLMIVQRDSILNDTDGVRTDSVDVKQESISSKNSYLNPKF